MTPTHEDFEIVRVLDAPIDRVWACWSDPALKLKWFVADHGDTAEYRLDFREGGSEYGRFVVGEGPGKGVHENRTSYLMVKPARLFVSAYTMAWDGRIHSASLATVQFEAAGTGTRLHIHEQGTWFAPSDGVEGRRHGTATLLDALARHLGTTTPP